MRRILLLIVLILLRLLTIAQKDCRLREYTQESLRRNPSTSFAMQDIENFTRNHTSTAGDSVQGSSSGSEKTSNLVVIPVVVHIVYNSAAQNISDAQVLSQLKVLNADYRKQNADTANIPSYFRALAADCGIQFALATSDTMGYATSGIIRKHTNIQAFAINDDMKSAATGGDNAWDRDSYLNIWVCPMANGVLGYSSVPGSLKATDGVVIDYRSFGTTGTATAPFNLGRTATHEIGHWLNLIHTWGDAYCGNDYVDDTPQQQAADLGNPTGILSSCGNGPHGDMYMNYMDLTDDKTMNMFTHGQVARMMTLFQPGGFRVPILSSLGLNPEPRPTGSSSNTPTSESGTPQTFSVYPNPSSGPVSITLTDASRIGSVLEVFNQLGQKMMTKMVDQLQVQLDVSSFQRGIYFIRIKDGNQSSTTKLVRI